MKKGILKSTACFLAIILIMALFPLFDYQTLALESAEKNTVADENSYSYYLSKQEEQIGAKEFSVDLSGSVISLNEQTQSGDVSVNVEEAGLYQIKLVYELSTEKDIDVIIGIKIDDQIPFTEAATIQLPREYENENTEIEVDINGNQLQPYQKQVDGKHEAVLRDAVGKYSSPYVFYFSKGQHKITFEKKQDDIAIYEMKFVVPKTVSSYKTVKDEWDSKGYKSAGERFRIEGENATLKNDSRLYPTSDNLSAATSPSDPMLIKMNTIGVNTWKEFGQRLTWKFDVKKEGYYNLAFRVRQNYSQGMATYRRVEIDDECLYEEMENVAFSFQTNWFIKELTADDKPAVVYLSEGEHTFSMEVSLGPLNDSLNQMEKQMYHLNNLYRKITAITGTTIDSNRDYSLDSAIPTLVDELKEIRNELSNILNSVEKASGEEGSQASFINEFVYQLDKMIARPNSISSLLDSFKSNISTLGDLITSMREQPLDLDYIEFYPEKQQAPKAKAGFFSQMMFDIKAFFASFVIEYGFVGIVDENSGDIEEIELWAGVGRDQAQILRRLTNDDFTKKNNVSVLISVVDSGNIISATLAGETPDLVFGCSGDLAINMASRNILLDLSTFDGYEEVVERFFESAVIPFYYDGKTYGIPTMQSFNVMFYRTDIFEELELSPPETWDDLYNLIPILQENGMTIGLPDMFNNLLYQRGVTLYSDDLNRVNYNTPEAYEAFKMSTRFYTDYSLPLTFDFYNRFRTGEMPIGITTYSFYNSLSVMAPELRDYWKMAGIPGTVREDGSICKTVLAGGETGLSILKDSKHADACFEFISWFTSADVQTRYGLEIENVLGTSGRYCTANKEAIKNLPWDNDASDLIIEQLENSEAVPNIPASYIVGRNELNAFRAVVYNYENEREVLNRYTKIINEEIIRKNNQLNKRKDG